MKAVFVIQRTAHPKLPFAVGIETGPGKLQVSRHWPTKGEARQDTAALNKAMRDNPEIAKALLAALAKR